MVLCRGDQNKTNPEDLRKHYLQNGLIYALPRLFEIVGEIPMLASGKIDRTSVKEMLEHKYLK